MARKKLFALFIALIMCMSMGFSACKSEKPASGASGQNTGNSGNSSGPSGKFVQKDVTPEKISGIAVSDMRSLPDGRILIITVPQNETPKAYATKDGSSWEEVYPYTDEGLISRYPSHSYIFTADNDGAWWVAVSNREGDNHLFKVSDGKEQEVELSVFQKGNAGFVSGLSVDDSNSLLISTGGEGGLVWTLADCAAASEISSFSPSPVQPFFAQLSGGSVYAGSQGEEVIVNFSADGKEQQRHSVPVGADELANASCYVKNGILYYCGSNGIYKTALDGSYLEALTESTSYVYADAAVGRECFVAANDDSYWLLARTGAANYKIYRYLFDESAPLTAASNLNIWAMDDNPMLRLAISVFTRENPDYDVQVEYGHSGENGAQTDDDIIRTLNTRLLSNDGPDVLILDGLPVYSMIKQGMLADLSGLVNEDDYYKNILSAFAVDGKTYAYPALFWGTLMAQKKGVSGPDLTGIKTIEDMLQLKSKDQIKYGGYYHMFESFYIAASADIFPKDSSVDEKALRSFLSVTKEISDAQGLSGSEYDEAFGNEFQDYDAAKNYKIDWGTDSPALAYFGNEYIANVSHGAGTLYGYNVWFFGENGGSLAPMPGKAFLPVCIGSVPAGAQNQDGGRLFVKTMLECQTVDNISGVGIPGFSVRLGTDKAVEMSMGAAVYKDAGIDLDKINLDGVMAQLTTAASVNWGLRQKLYAQAKLLYTGKINLDEAVKAVMKETELYFAEQK